MTVRPYDGAPEAFGPHSDRWEREGQRVIVEDDDGTHHAYQLPGGALVAKSLVTPSAAKATANAAEATKAATLEARRASMLANLREYVEAVKAKPANQRTPEEKVIRALAWLVGHDPDPPA